MQRNKNEKNGIFRIANPKKMGVLYNQDENFLPKHLFPALALEERSIFQSLLKFFIRQSLRQGKKLALCGRGFRGMAGIIAFAGEISGSSSEKSCNDSYIFGLSLIHI